VGDRDERMALNEALFRELNERAQEPGGTVPESGTREIYCECSSIDCIERIQITVDEYTSVRDDSRHFIVVPGHETVDVEHVVSRTDRFEVVRKEDEAAALADLLDPS